MRLFIGTVDTASILSELAEGFKANGIKVTTYVNTYSKFYKTTKYDIVRHQYIKFLSLILKSKKISENIKQFIIKIDFKLSEIAFRISSNSLINNHDVFVFIWQPWLDESYLFPLLKKRNKKIICIHLGSDVRHVSAFQQQYNIDIKDWEPRYLNDSINAKIKKIRFHEFYADILYSVPDQAGLLLKGFQHISIPLSNNKQIIFNIPKRKIPLIVHAPSASGIKGTREILMALEVVKSEGIEFEFKFIQNMPNKELLQLLSDADILIDELKLHGPGVLGIEAMAAGCLVMTKCLMQKPFTPPIIAINEVNIVESIKKAILNIELRIHLAENARKFVEKENNCVTIAKNILNDIRNDDLKLDYKSSFFLNHYVLPEGIVLTKEVLLLNYKVLKRLHLDSENIKISLKKRRLI